MLGQISIALFWFLSPGGLESSLWLHFSDFFLFLLSLSPHIWTKTQFGLFIDTFEAMGCCKYVKVTESSAAKAAC